MPLALKLILFATTACQISGQAGPGPQYPACGLIDADEGTIEVWVKLGFDAFETHRGYRGRGSFLHVDWADPSFPKDGLDFVVATKAVGPKEKIEMQCQGRVEIRIGGVRLRPLLINFTRQSARQWNHLAVVWQRGSVRALLNGHTVSLRDGFSPTIFAGAMARFGRGMYTIDDLRVSTVARDPDELSLRDIPLAPDLFTSLLLDFEPKMKARAELAPVAAALIQAASPQTISATHQLVRGRIGQGLWLMRGKSR